MMGKERADPFADTGDLDLSGFAPKPKTRPDPGTVRAVSEASEAMEFHSRAAKPRKAKEEPQPREEKPVLRRRRTGRNVQLNLKVTADAVARFTKLSDENGWVFGETFDKALDALEKQFAKRER